MRRSLPVLLLLQLAVFANARGGEVHAQAMLTPGERARLLLRAFSFDEALSERGELRIAVLYREDPSDAEALRLAFAEFGAAGVGGVSVSAISAPFESTGALLELVDEEAVTAIYVPESLATALSSIQQVTRARKVPSIAGSRRMVERGVSIGVYPAEASAPFAVNPRSAQVEGMRLAEQLLQIADILRAP